MTQHGDDPFFTLEMTDMQTLWGKSSSPEYSICTTLGYEKRYEIITAFEIKIFSVFCAQILKTVHSVLSHT